MPMASTMFAERKMKSSKNKKSSKNRGLNLTSTKDLGRWKPVDDLALIIGVQQTNDLKMVHRGTKFSCKFTLNELQNRWYSLLYEEAVSRIAVAAMRNLHPELVENIQSKALYTAQEEEVLATIKSVRYDGRLSDQLDRCLISPFTFLCLCRRRVPRWTRSRSCYAGTRPPSSVPARRRHCRATGS